MNQPLAHRRIIGDWRTELSAECVAQYRAGKSIREIAGDLGRSFGFVRAVILEGGEVLHSRGGRHPQADAMERRARIRELHSQGVPTSAIAVQVGCHVSTVSRVLGQEGGRVGEGSVAGAEGRA